MSGCTYELQEAVAVLGAGPETTLRMTIARSQAAARLFGGYLDGEEMVKTCALLNQSLENASAALSSKEFDDLAHLSSLLRAAIEALELDVDTTMQWLLSLSPDDVKKTLKKSPFSFVSTLLASRQSASDAFAAATAAATGPRANAAADHVKNHMKHWKQHWKHHKKKDEKGCGRQNASSIPPPPLPCSGLQMGAEGDDVAALQANLELLGFMRFGRNFHKRRGKYDHKTCDAVFRFQRTAASNDELYPFVPGAFCEETRAALVAKVSAVASVASVQPTTGEEQNEPSLLPQEFETEAGAGAYESHEVSITDTDGDTMTFKLTPDGSRVQEFVNGALEIDEVKFVQMDAETGVCKDSKGRFTVQPQQREQQMQALTALLARVGVATTPAPVQTVYIDVDLDAPEDEQQVSREQAGNRVREACATMGTDPEQALKKLAAVFGGLSIGQTAQGQRASAALSQGLEAAANSSFREREPAPYSSSVQAPEAFEYPEPATYSVVADERGVESAASVPISSSSSSSSFDSSTFEHFNLQLKQETGGREAEDEQAVGQWGEQLKQLFDMGLTGDNSEWELVEMLETHLGSVDRVVENLIQIQTDSV